MIKRLCGLAGVLLLLSAGVLRADDTIASAQQTLKDEGFYYGKITGRTDADTVAAIRRYQIRNGLKITGELNAETQQSLRITKDHAPATVPKPSVRSPADFREERAQEAPAPPRQYRAPRTFSAPTYAPRPYYYPQESGGIFAGTAYEMASPAVQQRVIADAQMVLAQRGYYRSDIDGIYGPGTEFALRAFQSRIGLRLTGRFDTPTLRALGLTPGRRYRPVPARRTAPAIYRGEWIPE